MADTSEEFPSFNSSGTDLGLDLHLKMISYVCQKDCLDESVFNYIWMRFKDKYQTELSANDLKLLFHNEIMKDLEKYDISSEWKEYLAQYKYGGMNDPENILRNNEPKLNVDYKYIDSDDNSGLAGSHSFDEKAAIESLKTAKKYKGNFEDEDPEEDDASYLRISNLNVQNKGEDRKPFAGFFHLLKSFVLDPDEDQNVSDAEMINKLKDPQSVTKFLHRMESGEVTDLTAMCMKDSKKFFDVLGGQVQTFKEQQPIDSEAAEETLMPTHEDEFVPKFFSSIISSQINDTDQRVLNQSDQNLTSMAQYPEPSSVQRKTSETSGSKRSRMTNFEGASSNTSIRAQRNSSIESLRSNQSSMTQYTDVNSLEVCRGTASNRSSMANFVGSSPNSSTQSVIGQKGTSESVNSQASAEPGRNMPDRNIMVFMKSLKSKAPKNIYRKK